MSIQNIINASTRLDKANQYDPFEEGLKQVDKVFSAMETFEKETNEKAMNNAENFVEGAIGYDLFPPAAQDIIYGKLKTTGEEMAAAEAAGDRKKVRELKLQGSNLISITNTLGSILKDHSEDLLGTDGEGNYSTGSNLLMMNMLINKEYTIRDDETNGMVIDFTGAGYTGKSGIKLDELDEHVFLKMRDGAVAYNDGIKNIRNNARNKLPFEQDAFKKTIKRTLNTDQKLITSVWDDNFTLKDGKTLKEIWEEENVGKDANEYLRTSGTEWEGYKEELRTWASNKLFTGGENEFKKYTPLPTNPMGDDGIPTFKNYVSYSYTVGEGDKKKLIEKKMSPGAAQTLFLQLQDGVVDDPQRKGVELRYIDGSDGTGWYDGNVLAYETTKDLVKDNSLNEPEFQNIKTKIVKADTRDDNTYDVKYRTGADYTTLEGGDKKVATNLNNLIFPQTDTRNPNGLYFARVNMLSNEVELYNKENKPFLINGQRVKYRVRKSASLEVKSSTLKKILDMLDDQKLLKNIEYPEIDFNSNVAEVPEEETPKTPKKPKGFNFKSE